MMTLGEALGYCKQQGLTIKFGGVGGGVTILDEGLMYKEVWDTDFVDAVIQMKEWIEGVEA